MKVRCGLEVYAKTFPIYLDERDAELGRQMKRFRRGLMKCADALDQYSRDHCNCDHVNENEILSHSHDDGGGARADDHACILHLIHWNARGHENDPIWCRAAQIQSTFMNLRTRSIVSACSS